MLIVLTVVNSLPNKRHCKSVPHAHKVNSTSFFVSFFCLVLFCFLRYLSTAELHPQTMMLLRIVCFLCVKFALILSFTLYQSTHCVWFGMHHRLYFTLSIPGRCDLAYITGHILLCLAQADVIWHTSQTVLYPVCPRQMWFGIHYRLYFTLSVPGRCELAYITDCILLCLSRQMWFGMHYRLYFTLSSPGRCDFTWALLARSYLWRAIGSAQ